MKNFETSGVPIASTSGAGWWVHKPVALEGRYMRSFLTEPSFSSPTLLCARLPSLSNLDIDAEQGSMTVLVLSQNPDVPLNDLHAAGIIYSTG